MTTVNEEEIVSPGPTRKYVGVGSDGVPALGILQADIMRLMWNTGGPQSCRRIFDDMHHSRRRERRVMCNYSTLKALMGKMTKKGLLTVDFRTVKNTGYYYPRRTQGSLVADIINDVSFRLTGQPFGFLLSQMKPGTPPHENENMNDIAKEFLRRQADDSTYISYSREK
jgi:predicted transcriptional regulator